MVLRIAKTFDFDAAHHLPMTPDDHKCHRMHGHTYRVEVSLRGKVEANGMIVDYADMAAAWQPIHDILDHRVLNDIPGLENPTTEVLVEWLVGKFSNSYPAHGKVRLWAIRVYESSTTWVEWMP